MERLNAAASRSDTLAFKSRTVPATRFCVDAWISEHVAADDQLRVISDAILHGLAADSLLVVLHRSGIPVILIDDGSLTVETCAAMQHSAKHAASIGGPRGIWYADAGNVPPLLSTCIATGDGVITVTALLRPGDPAALEQSRHLGNELLPLIQPFFCLWSQRYRAAIRMRSLTAAVEKSDVGVVLVDGDGQVIFANAVAETMMAQADGIRRIGHAIGGTRLADTLRLQSAVEHVIAGVGRTPAATAADVSPVLAFARKSRRPIMAAIIACDDGPSSPPDGTAIIYLFDPEEDLRLLLEPACKLYGLTPIETKLACLLADGMSLTAAAGQLHIREQTARSYLKTVFLKTETNRQAELVWLLLKSTVRTAPGCRMGLI